jgi:uncharacterized protein
MYGEDFRLAIESGDLDRIRGALDSDRALANQSIHWFLNQHIESDPLHYISDCISHGWLTNGKEGEIAELLLAYGAAIDGTEDRESPLIASVSLGAEKVCKVLVEAGAALECTSVDGSRALHWAAWMGLSPSVELLIAHHANIEAKCSEFAATPLFWAVHGYGPRGPQKKTNQVAAARLLIQAGASVDTKNKHGVSALEQAELCANRDMFELLHAQVA